MKVAQLMTKDVRTCRQTDMLDHAVRLMWDHDSGALPVIDAFGVVIGMVTDRDACIAALMQGQPLQCVPVSVAMSKNVVACRPDDTDRAVSRLMAKHKIRRIPVVDDGQRPIGIVSLDDLALAMAKRAIPPTEVAETLAAICEHRASSQPARV
jgi:CBS domain-containing protein